MTQNSKTNNSSSREEFVYEGRDLEAMNFAENYHRWVLSKFDGYINSNILEVGAGSGSFSKLIIEKYPNNLLTSLEPSNEMYPLLEKNLKGVGKNVILHKSYTNEIVKDLKDKKISAIIYNNVLEHIENDQEEIKLAYDILEKDGYILTFSPALPALYGKLDKKIGHYRRYSLNEMKVKLVDSGFEVVEAYYFDFVGMILWWIKFKLLGSDEIGSGNVALFDKYLVPVLRSIEPSKLLPIGKNIVVIGKKI